jgi:hypothetical protein
MLRLLLAVTLFAALAVRAARGALCPEAVSFVRANDLRCQPTAPNVTTTRCHGRSDTGGVGGDGYCFIGQCNNASVCVESDVFACDCEAARYLECAADADCEPLLDTVAPTARACATVHCLSQVPAGPAGFCELRLPAAPVPDGCCTVDADCDDGNECTDDRCDVSVSGSAQCTHQPSATGGVGCCATTRDCQGPPAQQPLCPESVCDAAACLLTPTAPTCVGLETCRGDRFSYCAVDTVIVPGESGTLQCQGDPLQTPGRSCVMTYANGQCSFGTCTESDGGVVRCVPQPELAGALFPCGCACGERVTEQQVCGAAGTAFAYQCVNATQAGGGGAGGGSDGSTASSLAMAMIGIVAALCLLLPLGVVIYCWVRECRRQRAKRRRAA